MAGSLGLGLGFEEHSTAQDSSAAMDGSCFWIKTGSELKPYAAGTVTDYNLMWDLDGVDYMPQSAPTTDCNWEFDGTDVMPISV
jgi:hypothetical protein|tara:strand:- start:328 stop:579 length:252 start_codon:yes stop_codon:yes gene_type:complete